MKTSQRPQLPRDRGINKTLRNSGFVQLPPLWVAEHEMPKIHEIAHRYQDEVNTVRAKCRGEVPEETPDPRHDKDAAWEAFEAARSA